MWWQLGDNSMRVDGNFHLHDGIAGVSGQHQWQQMPPPHGSLSLTWNCAHPRGETFCYRAYNITVRDLRDPRYMRGPFSDEDDSCDTCCCPPYTFCRKHACCLNQTKDEWWERKSNTDRKTRNHKEAYTPDWHTTYNQNQPNTLVEGHHLQRIANQIGLGTAHICPIEG